MSLDSNAATARPRPAEALAQFALRGPLAAGLALLVVAQLVCWIPQYLRWPLYADHDVFATAARSWDAGIKPYREAYCNNLPGTIYLFWIVGKVAGWDRPSAFFAVDAATVVAFCGILVFWSKRCFGGFLPGLVAALTFLGLYLDLNYALAAQRDWHAPFLAMAGLLLAQTLRGGAGSIVSAIGLALALTFRPQAIVFLPACLAQMVLEGEGRTLRNLIRWGAAFLATLALAYAPILLQGLGPDLLASLRLTTPGSSYSRFGATRLVEDLVRPFGSMATVAVLAAIGLLIGPAQAKTRPVVRTWLIAFFCVLAYKAISPFPHVYLDLPIRIVGAVLCGLLAELILETGTAPASVRVVGLLLVLGLGVELKPRFANPGGSLQSIKAAWQGETLTVEPNGYRPTLGMPAAAYYPWEDYAGMLDYLRQFPAEIRVANALKEVPAITGPTGRLSAFPAESIAWLKMVRKEDEPRFAADLEAANDAVVVWIPDEIGLLPSFRTDLVDEVIRRRFEHDRRFGPIEVWRRRQDGSQ